MYHLALEWHPQCVGLFTPGETPLSWAHQPHISGIDMVNFPGRDRRRRVLKDEVLSASSNYANLRTSDDDFADDAPRYSDAAGVENHPQVTDFIPRRYTSIAMLVGVGAVSTAVLAAALLRGADRSPRRGIRSGEAFDLSSTGSIASWIAAVVTLLASAACMLTYSIRRHRIDDFRGRYRVWLGARCGLPRAEREQRRRFSSGRGRRPRPSDGLVRPARWRRVVDAPGRLATRLDHRAGPLRRTRMPRRRRVTRRSPRVLQHRPRRYLGVVQVGDTETRSIDPADHSCSVTGSCSLRSSPMLDSSF